MLILLPINSSLPERAMSRLIQVALETQIAHNMLLLARNPDRYPPLYESRVRYRPERDLVRLANGIPVEEFADLETLHARGWGDCDDLVAALIAEWRINGEAGAPRVFWRKKDVGGRLFHVMARHLPDRHLWDPSRDLGMTRREG